MTRIIRLADLTHVPLPPPRSTAPAYAADTLARARAALVGRSLRYDNRTGIIRDRTGWLERPSKPGDFTPHDTAEAVMEWEFSRFIRNAASRIERGLEP
jgi:hypothetical protein